MVCGSKNCPWGDGDDCCEFASCVDSQLPTGVAWADSEGEDCNEYDVKDGCKHGDLYANEGLTANQVCCACGGGGTSATVSFFCTVGQHVSAVWSGDGNYYGAVVVGISEDNRLITVSWDDGRTSHLDVTFSEAKDDTGTVCTTATPTSTFICTIGQHISALWSGTGSYYGAVVVGIAEDTRLVTVNWDDGSTPSRLLYPGSGCGATNGTRTGNCCTNDNQCGINEGDCDSDAQCLPGLVCGQNNCPWGGGGGCCEGETMGA